MEAGADLNTPKGILEMAVQCHNLEALNWLLDSGKVSPNDKAPKTGCTPLTTAIRENRPDLVVCSANIPPASKEEAQTATIKNRLC